MVVWQTEDAPRGAVFYDYKSDWVVCLKHTDADQNVTSDSADMSSLQLGDYLL